MGCCPLEYEVCGEALRGGVVASFDLAYENFDKLPISMRRIRLPTMNDMTCRYCHDDERSQELERGKEERKGSNCSIVNFKITAGSSERKLAARHDSSANHRGKG